MKSQLSLLLFLSLAGAFASDSRPLPQLRTNQGTTQLILNEQPWIILGGQLHNSSASHPDHLRDTWKRLNMLHVNTVFAPVYWELFEPEEGRFDVTLVNALIQGARENNKKLVLLWFGTWKNTWSTYVPEWVKRDPARFPRYHLEPGKPSGGLSAFHEATLNADRNAFRALMRHLRLIDEKEQTVIMVQVENETGIHAKRDYSPAATEAFEQQVPAELLSYLRSHESELVPELKILYADHGLTPGTWRDVFSDGAEEVFQAWHIARYVEQVAAAGKAEYSLPMYVNAWLDPSHSLDTEAKYPKGGPVAKVMEVWRAAAPSIDLYAPDIYLDDFKKTCELYHRAGNPLFIPEAQSKTDSRSIANVYYALGQHQAIAFSPFGIDSGDQILGISKAYESLSGFLPFLAQHQNSRSSIGFVRTKAEKEKLSIGDYDVEITFTQDRSLEAKTAEGAGLILHPAPGEYYIAGFGFKAHFELPDPRGGWVEIIAHEEGRFENGIWMPRRRLNGDELKVNLDSTPQIRRVRLHTIRYDLPP